MLASFQGSNSRPAPAMPAEYQQSKGMCLPPPQLAGARDIGAVETSVLRQDNAIAELFELTNSLEGRLVPVLHVSPSHPGTDTKVGESTCPLSAKLDEHSARIEFVSARLRSLLGQLAL